jgi:hypothetical protein
VALRATRKTKTGTINSLASTKQRLELRRKKARSKVSRKTEGTGDRSKTEGIKESGIQRRKLTGECLRCAGPSDKKGTHWVKDCVRHIKLDKGTHKVKDCV